MKKQIAISLAAALGSVLCASAASADTVVTTAPARETVVSGGPNSALLGSGIVALGIPYAASVIVAASSSHPGDHNLYVPVAGPWMDLANRGDCGRIDSVCSNDNETANKVLLVGDGILQGIGALEIVGAFLMPETHYVAASAPSGPKVMVGPSHVGRSGYGLAAVGTF